MNLDVDFVPHTLEEASDPNSTLYNPRYHPSLCFGTNVKHSFPLPEKIDSVQDNTAYVLLDNRTITRRQILRPNDVGSWTIFLAKLRHGPGNALTYKALHEGKPYYSNPSDMPQCFGTFDRIFGTDSGGIIKLFDESKQLLSLGMSLPFEDATKLLRWHESLIATVLQYNPSALKEFFQEAKVSQEELAVEAIPV